MQILAIVLSVLGLVAMIVASLIKGTKMKLILLLVFLGNISVATSYVLDGKGINGAAACYLGAAMAIINYFYDSKNIAISKWLIAVYVVAIAAVNIWVAGGITPLGVLVIVASLTFVFCIGQSNGARYRFWTIINMILWCTYDFVAPAYPALVTHVSLLIFTVVGMIVHDRKEKITKTS